MARIRSIKPEFFTSLTVAELDIHTRLTFIGLWTHVDDEGRCVDDPRLIKAALWPLDDRVSADVERDLKRLSESSLILRYKVGERSYICVRGWEEHQRINRPTKSKIPPPSMRTDPPPNGHAASSQPAETPAGEPECKSPTSGSVRAHASLTEDSLGERNREQGTGNRENPPTPRAAERVEPEPEGDPGRAEQLVTAWMLGCNRRPPGRVVDDVGRLVAEMLRDGIDAADIERGIQLWQSRGASPRTLPSFVNQVMNARPSNVVALNSARPSTTDQRVGAALALAEKFREDPA